LVVFFGGGGGGDDIMHVTVLSNMKREMAFLGVYLIRASFHLFITFKCK